MELGRAVVARCSLLAFLLNSIVSAQTGPGSQPVRYQAQYTRIYSDDIESVGPLLSTAFSLDTGGSITTNPAEVISGKRSIKGVAAGSFANFFRTNPVQLPFSPGGAYRVTFRYKILATLVQGGNVVFFSNAANAAHYSGNVSAPIRGNTGDSGTITFSGTLGPYSDYQVYWSLASTGAVAIDDIQIFDVTGKVIASEDAEGSGPAPGAGLVLNGGTVTTDPALVIGGKASVHLVSPQEIVTDASAVPLAGKGTYIFEFDYRVLHTATEDSTLYLWFHPPGISWNAKLVVNASNLLKNAPARGRHSAGAQLGAAVSYVFHITAAPGADIIIDNLTIYRQDSVPAAVPPPSWVNLATAPFPRLGVDMAARTLVDKVYGIGPGAVPYRYSIDQVYNQLAFDDLIVGAYMETQPRFPESVKRLRAVNPNVVILLYRITAEQGVYDPPGNSTISADYTFLQGLADGWFVRDSKGNYVPDPDYPDLRKLNLSPYAPIVNGVDFIGYEANWLNTTMFPSGIWDGVNFDNMFSSINFHILNYDDPALLDFDFNRNGIRDETPAMVSDVTRSGTAKLLQQLRSTNGDLQLIIGNQGPSPEPSLAPYVNGFLFECFNVEWGGQTQLSPTFWSPARWRKAFDAYRLVPPASRCPNVNLITVCGSHERLPDGQYSTDLSASDISVHRFTLGTALLGDAFYGYNLHGSGSPNFWFDEFSVDSGGMAVEDVSKKGYLGQALSDATELPASGTLILQENFEVGAMPASFTPDPSSNGTVYLSRDPGEVISGTGSLVLSNPDHTRKGTARVNTDPKVLRLTPSTTYLLTFDWRILETLDNTFGVGFGTDPNRPYDRWNTMPGAGAGDHGTAHVPFMTSNSTQWLLSFVITNGGGKVAIDNVSLMQGGVGPWRRDFENGFVLVNPFQQSRTFSAAELTGSLQRTGIRRIKGTQAPDVNNGQPVTGGLTLGAFDAIILLADHIDAPRPSGPKPGISGVVSAGAFGGFSSIAPGSWIEIYGSNLSATTRGWSNSDFNGSAAPTVLDGVSVTVGGRAAYVAYVSPGQINALAASDTAIGPMHVVVNGPNGSSDPYRITVQPTQPGLLAPPAFQVSGKQYAAALFPDGRTFVLPAGAISGLASRPAKPGESITLYGVGFGPVTPGFRAGTLVSTANTLSNPLQVSIGGARATVSFQGLAPYLTGLYQFNVVVPDVADGAAVPVTFQLNGVAGTQTLYIAVQR